MVGILGKFWNFLRQSVDEYSVDVYDTAGCGCGCGCGCGSSGGGGAGGRGCSVNFWCF